MKHVHIIGAGLAGLSAAVALAGAGRGTTIYEAGPAAGGRCRSYFDRELGCRIDNGNHLLLSGNTDTLDYLVRTGARDTLGGPGRAVFPFIDLASGERWSVEPSEGRVPWWVLRRDRRVPGTRLREYLAVMALRKAGINDTVAEVLDNGSQLYRKLLEPLSIAALNTPPSEAMARLLNTVISETLLRGGHACIPMFPRVGLSETFVDPAIAWLGSHGGTLQTGQRVVALRIESRRVVAIETSDGPIPVAAEEGVVLAVPAWVAADLLPGLAAPDAFQAILNVHFRTDADPGLAGFLGIVGGTAEWLFVKPGIVSVTVSAANRLVDLPAEAIARLVWPNVRVALKLADPMPPARVVKERRATFAATAVQDSRRPGPDVGIWNLALAGDWTATGLPATIEGAIRSGRAAATALIVGNG